MFELVKIPNKPSKTPVIYKTININRFHALYYCLREEREKIKKKKKKKKAIFDYGFLYEEEKPSIDSFSCFVVG